MHNRKIRKPANISKIYKYTGSKNMKGNNTIASASAWSVATLPKFCEYKLAEFAFEIGWYNSPDEAYHQIPEEKLEKVKCKSSEYRKQHKRPKSWKVASVPHKQF